MTETQQLLRAYIEQESDSAFRELVTRYIDLVYSVALRKTGQDTMNLMFSISTPYPLPPPEAAGNLDLLAQWRETPEFKAAIKTVQNYVFGQNEDGFQRWL